MGSDAGIRPGSFKACGSVARCSPLSDSFLFAAVSSPPKTIGLGAESPVQ